VKDPHFSSFNRDALFHVTQHKRVVVKMMKKTASFRVANLDNIGAKALEIPYKGTLSRGGGGG
jgi:serine protease inhibitor